MTNTNVLLKEEFKKKFSPHCEHWEPSEVADYWLSKLDQAIQEDRQRIDMQQIELWLLRLHNEPERWTVAQAMKDIINLINKE